MPCAAGPRERERQLKKRSYRGLAVLLSAFVVLALAPSALAQAPVPGYGGQAGGVAGATGTGGGATGDGVAGEQAAGGVAGASAASEAGDPGSDGGLLAFTGLDLLLIAGGGLLLVATGVALSRMVARNPA